MNNLFVYLPCYNEQGNIAELVNDWLEQKNQLKKMGYLLCVVPVDDKSTDSTLKIIKEFEKTIPDVRVIAHSVNQNLGGVLSSSVDDFINVSADGDLMCVMDGDNTHKPEYIFSMLDAIIDSDCVIASRYQKGSKVIGVPRNRLFLSDCAKIYNTVVLNVPGVRDYTCGYRLYKRSILIKAREKFPDSLIRMKNFSCMMEFLYKLHLCGAKFKEVPFVLRYDKKGGSSKMKVIKTMASSLILALKLKLKRF